MAVAAALKEGSLQPCKRMSEDTKGPTSTAVTTPHQVRVSYIISVSCSITMEHQSHILLIGEEKLSFEKQASLL